MVTKFSSQYYKILYSAGIFIGTEAPQHVHVIRGVNPYIKKVLHDALFVFLQHGISYCTDYGASTILSRDKEFEPDFICASSKKETRGLDISLQLEHDKIVYSGIPIFDTLKYKHIDQNSADKVMIMLTWRPEDIGLTDFEESYNCKMTLEIYEMLKSYVSAANIIVISHPLIKDRMMETKLAESIYKGTLSEALKETKLLITDFSSVCYNSFYQGAGVLFLQDPLYVDRELIPKDDEWIGRRALSIDELKEHCRKGIEDGVVKLDYFRTSEHEMTYHTINEFCDGMNKARILDCLTEKGLFSFK